MSKSNFKIVLTDKQEKELLTGESLQKIVVNQLEKLSNEEIKKLLFIRNDDVKIKPALLKEIKRVCAINAINYWCAKYWSPDELLDKVKQAYSKESRFTFRNFLDELGIKNWKCQEWGSKTINKYEYGEVLCYKYNKLSGWGVAVIKGERTLMPVEVIRCPQGQHNSGTFGFVFNAKPTRIMSLFEDNADEGHLKVLKNDAILKDIAVKGVIKSA